MNRDDIIFRRFVIVYAIVEAIVIAIFIVIKLQERIP
jgi:hypothetical protein